MSNINAINQKWINNLHNYTEKGYDTAIASYEIQKKNFLKQYQAGVNDAKKDFMYELNKAAAEDVELHAQEDFDKAIENVATEMVNFFIAQSEGSGTKEYNDLINRYNELILKGQNGTAKIERLADNMTAQLNKFLDQAYTRENLLKIVAGNNTGLSSMAESTDLQNNIFGYARKYTLALLDKKISGSNKNQVYYELNQKVRNDFYNAFKGYYKEGYLVHPLEKVLSEAGMQVKQTGSLTNEKKKQIKYDLLIGTSYADMSNDNFLTDILKQWDNINAEDVESLDADGILGGIQSKSWELPFNPDNLEESINKKPYIRIGYNSKYYKEINAIKGLKYKWHAGAALLTQNMLEILGKRNFIYSTKNRVMWTDEMLKGFKYKNYVLAYEMRINKDNKYRAKEITSRVVFTDHSDNFASKNN